MKNLRAVGHAFIVASAGVSIIAGWALGASVVAAGNVPSYHNKSMYDNTTPGIATNVTERVCVVDYTDDTTFVQATWQPIIVGWLNEATNWEGIGTTKVDFVSDCVSPNIRIEIFDPYDPEWTDPTINTCGVGAGGCAPRVFGSSTSTDGHAHWSVTGIMIQAPAWTCLPAGSGCYSTNAAKKNLIVHEMGHVLGLDHYGPVNGAVGKGGLHYGIYANYDGKPSTGELYQARAHLNGQSSPAYGTCMGFPAANRILVSWFDTANDETSNSTWVYRKANTSGAPYVQYLQMSGSVSPGIGNRVNFLSGVRSDIPGYYYDARADVRGGPRNTINWDPAEWGGANPDPTLPPNGPCTLSLTATGGGNVRLDWKDASFNEDKWHIYYSVATDDYGTLPAFVYRGDCGTTNSETCNDSASSPGSGFTVNSRLCAYLRSGSSSLGASFKISNVACTKVLP